MPRWEGIEDASAQAPAVWLSRMLGGGSSSTTVSTSWKPLRKADCLALNKNNDNSKVYIEGGRSTADPVTGLIRYNFFRGHDRELCSAVWFVKEEKGKDTILHPVTDVADSVLMETLYQKAVEATSSLGKGISSVLDEVLLLRDGESKIQVNKSGDVLTMRKVPSGWFKNSLVLQRGYGEYKIPGEETELALGPVKHLVFVVHGIGEALFSREEIKVTGLIEQTHTARMELQRKQLAAWKKDGEKADKAGTAKPPPPARIELIPIEWFNRMHDSSSALMRSLKATTLNTIPALRAIANDVVFDVLMYLTPAFCEGVLETVTEQINDVYSTFQVVHPDFLQSGGKCSLAGHSLGSVICWDLLAVLKQSKPVSPLESTCGVSVAGKAGYQAYAQAEHADKAQNGTYGPSLNKPMKQTIPFVPEHTLFLGSPLGIFLTLRGAHPVFDEMRLQAKRSEETSGVPSVSPFTLPTKSLYNIFHPR
jgi:DDHD domain